jgi:hypothetical protein
VYGVGKCFSIFSFFNYGLYDFPAFIKYRDTNDKLIDKKEPYTDDYKEELLFLKKHLDVLKKLTSNYEKSSFLALDKQIYAPNARFVNKNIKVNQQVYEQFTKLCDSKFRHLKIQDLIAQALLDFIYKYSTD